MTTKHTYRGGDRRELPDDVVAGELVASESKTAKSRRTLPINDTETALLKAQHKSQSECARCRRTRGLHGRVRLCAAVDKLRAGSVWTDSGYVFTTEHGLPMDPRNVLRAVTLAANKAGLAGVNIHTLKHSATTTMLESGIHCEP